MNALFASIEGVGFWSDGLPSWADAIAHVRDGTLPDAAPARPAPQVLAPNERRRAPESVAVALEVAHAACAMAGRDPATLPSVFASTHGDLAITDYMCATLAGAADTVSPTRFHNSVHNAAAGYWTIGTGCLQPATALSAYDASFAQGLLEALAHLAAGAEAVLLVAYDAAAVGPLAQASPSAGLLGGALVLARTSRPGVPNLRVASAAGDAPAPQGALARRVGGNAMPPMHPLYEALAAGEPGACLHAGPGRLLRLEFTDA